MRNSSSYEEQNDRRARQELPIRELEDHIIVRRRGVALPWKSVSLDSTRIDDQWNGSGTRVTFLRQRLVETCSVRDDGRKFAVYSLKSADRCYVGKASHESSSTLTVSLERSSNDSGSQRERERKATFKQV